MIEINELTNAAPQIVKATDMENLSVLLEQREDVLLKRFKVHRVFSELIGYLKPSAK